MAHNTYTEHKQTKRNKRKEIETKRRSFITCWSNRPSDVEVEVVGSIDGHVQIFIGLKKKKKEEDKQIIKSLSSDVYVFKSLGKNLLEFTVLESWSESLGKFVILWHIN